MPWKLRKKRYGATDEVGASSTHIAALTRQLPLVIERVEYVELPHG